MSFLSSFIRSFYAKALFVIIIGTIGLLIGIRFGYSSLLEDEELTKITGPDQEEYAPIALMFGLGDLLPWEPIITRQGDTANFEQVLIGNESVVFFMHLDCETCVDLLKFWRAKVNPKLKPGTKLIACLPETIGKVPEYYEALFADMTVVFYDEAVWQKKYNMKLFPAMLGVDKSGFVVAQQFGFEGFIEFDFIQRFCTGR